MNVAVSPKARSLSWRRLLLVTVLCLLAPRLFAQTPSLAEHRAQAVTQVVLGILSYARWPVEPAQLRLCIVGPTQYTDDLVKGTTQATGRPVLVRRLLVDHPDIVNACDAVYIGKITPDERNRLFTSLIGHPVLSISEGATNARWAACSACASAMSRCRSRSTWIPSPVAACASIPVCCSCPVVERLAHESR